VIRRIALFLVLVASPLAAQTNGSTTRSVAHGVYTDDQAERGKTAFEMHCASCHELSFHTGEEFRFAWFGRSVYDLFKVIKTTMPEDNIGGLTDDEYTRVIAYILKLNGFPAGKDSLAADSISMGQIKIGPATTDTLKQFRR